MNRYRLCREAAEGAAKLPGCADLQCGWLLRGIPRRTCRSARRHPASRPAGRIRDAYISLPRDIHLLAIRSTWREESPRRTAGRCQVIWAIISTAHYWVSLTRTRTSGSKSVVRRLRSCDGLMELRKRQWLNENKPYSPSCSHNSTSLRICSFSSSINPRMIFWFCSDKCGKNFVIC